MIRRLALAAFLITVLSTAMGFRKASVGMAGLPQRSIFVIPAAVVAGLFDCVMPALLFALYRNRGTLRLSARRRLIALGGAILLAANLRGPVGQGITALYSQPLNPEVIFGSVSDVLSLLALAILLLTLSLRAPDKPDRPVAPLLRRVTRLAIVWWTVVLLGLLVRLSLTHALWLRLNNLAAQYGSSAPPESAMWLAMLNPLTTFAGFLAVPLAIATARAAFPASQVPPPEPEAL